MIGPERQLAPCSHPRLIQTQVMVPQRPEGTIVGNAKVLFTMRGCAVCGVEIEPRVYPGKEGPFTQEAMAHLVVLARERARERMPR